jgi:hypothetical protein
MEPRDPSNPNDVAAAARALEQDLGWFAAPLYFGDYPTLVKATKPVSKERGFVLFLEAGRGRQGSHLWI